MIEREVYDPATKVWTTICAVMIGWIVNWFAVIVPSQHRPPEDPSMFWWTVATVFIAAPPLAWTIGHLMRRDNEGTVMWVLPFALVVCMQFVLLKWSGG